MSKNTTHWKFLGGAICLAAALGVTPLQAKDATRTISKKTIISTPKAPSAIGTYSQAVKVGNTVYLSGQIGIDPATSKLVEGIDAQIVQVFENLKAVTEAAGGSLSDIVKLNIYLTDLANFSKVNDAMAKYFSKPFPARAAVGIAALPRNALVEAEGVVALSK